jgi:hypothetical protein
MKKANKQSQKLKKQLSENSYSFLSLLSALFEHRGGSNRQDVLDEIFFEKTLLNDYRYENKIVRVFVNAYNDFNKIERINDLNFIKMSNNPNTLYMYVTTCSEFVCVIEDLVDVYWSFDEIALNIPFMTFLMDDFKCNKRLNKFFVKANIVEAE